MREARAEDGDIPMLRRVVHQVVAVPSETPAGCVNRGDMDLDSFTVRIPHPSTMPQTAKELLDE